MIMCGGQCQLRYISPCSGGYPPIGVAALGENLGSVCRQDSQTLSLKFTFLAKNIPLNIQILPKIARPYTVSGVSIPFIRPFITDFTDLENKTPFLNRQNARDSLQVLTNYLSLSKNMKTFFLAKHTHLGLMFETQSSL